MRQLCHDRTYVLKSADVNKMEKQNMATLYGISTLWNISLKAKLQGLHVHVQLLGIMHIIDDVIKHDYAQQ